MYKKYFHKDDFNLVERISKSIYEAYIEADKSFDEIIVIGIGTDRCIGDAIGPLVGTFLEKYNNKNYTIYGTLDFPMHATNMEKRLVEINKRHENAFVIAIDAVISDRDELDNFMIRNYPVKPGAGVGKSLPRIGDISILYSTDTDDNEDIFHTGNNIRLNGVFNASKIIAEAINKACDEIIKNKINYDLIAN